MSEKRKLNRWGWGLHVDKQGNLHDVFPRALGERTPKPKSKWHVKPKLRKCKLVLSH